MATKRLKTLKRWQAIFIIVMMAALFCSTRPTLGCGPFVARAVFTYEKHPDLPLTRFAAGELGVLEPAYARSYLVVAYRYFTGAGLDKEEQKSALALWDERLKPYWETDQSEDWVKAWLEALSKIPGANAQAKPEVFRSEDRKDFYVNYLNCPQDAFRNAADTLNKLIAKYGASSAEAKDFAATQQQVFAVCSEGKGTIEAAAPSASPTIKANRAYQIAAANFYAGNFDAAGQMFKAIAADGSSPFRQIAPYLVARTLIRKATLTTEHGKVDNAALTQAQAQLEKILADKNQTTLHQSARGLRNFVRFRLDPESRLHELAQDLLKKNAGASLKQDLLDYTRLLDRFTGEDDDSEKERTFAGLPKAGREDDLTDWVLTFQIQDADALNYSLQKWEKTGATPWLVAALTKINADHPKAAALVSAATAKLKSASPVTTSIAYHLDRLMIESNRKDEARLRLDELFASSASSLPASALNRFLSLRMRVATNLNEFLRYSERVPSGVTYDEDGRELPMDKDEASDDVKNSPRIRASWDEDATRVLNEMMPLSVLKEAALNKTLHTHLRKDLAIAVWARAALLDDEATALVLIPAVESLAPELKQYLDAYVAAQDKAAKKFAAVYLMLKFPGTRPTVDSSMGRAAAFGEIESYRDNWWCEYGQTVSPDNQNVFRKVETQNKISAPDFLTAAQKTTASAEWKRLAALGTGPNYLSAQAVKWAGVKPDDARAPEALHLAVRATRYGCTDKQTGTFSKQAYDTLHRKYPKSEWAQKTKYWFKD
ncbi:MAG TPA: hypothetical protein VJX74_06525 [Blastocatellia bacterium]|nr:hypothetical protein [Blastocatellia bacterium]